MPAALIQFNVRPNIEGLYKQLDMCPYIQGRMRDVLEDYLLRSGIYSLDEVDDEIQYDYREFVSNLSRLTERQAAYYQSALETVVLHYHMPDYQNLISEAEEIPIFQRTQAAYKNKVLYYLMVHGIHHLEEIEYPIRAGFEEYLTRTGFSKTTELVKKLDYLKLHSIEQNNKSSPLKKHKLVFREELIYLGYHPDYDTAMNFYYLRDKNELVFDFSLDAPVLMKRQIFAVLNYALERETNRKNRRELYIVPLKRFYLYCVEKKIEDIEELEYEDIDGFRQSMDGKVGTKTDTYMIIVDNVRKYLFLNATRTNWNANVWYMERFCFKGDRMNPALPVESVHFYLVRNKENRRLLQEFMKYSIGVSSRSISTIRTDYYRIYEFLQYCDKQCIQAKDLTAIQFEEYTKAVDKDGIRPETYNLKLGCVAKFYQFLLTKGHVSEVTFNVEYYYKAVVMIHHDRQVPEETQMKLLAHLKYFPEDIRLMYLNLWCVGLRVNEVCCIKGDAYFWKGQDAWIKIYQYKMKTEKVVPIPEHLYNLMKRYIAKNQIQSDEFVFKSAKGRAYDVGTFITNMKQWCKKYDISCGDYIFRSHDYRHTVGTKMYDSGVSIQAVRDYLGHKEEDMTKQYLDYIPEKVDQANEQYFAKSTGLAGRIKVRRKEDGNKDISS